MSDRHDGGAPRAVWRMRMLAVCLGLTAVAFLQAPGLMAIDTKVDLVVDPAGLLGRALHVWDPTGTFGQLQNQAYGYLWPMGPFFLLGDALGIPGWAIQRLWWSLLLIVAFTGVVTLAERLRIGTPWARIIAGVAFALSPRLLTELGPISVEAWPSAIAPWVLVPLIGLRHGAPLRRSIARSALAVACAGGVNATAVLAVVPLAAIWLAGLRPARLRFTALAAWGAAVAAATAWWLVPLLLLGRYSPPFLDYIETADVTTATTDAVSVLRGTSHWHAYLNTAFGPLWPAGWQLANETALVIATVVVAALGLAGLARRGMPHRWFLVTGLLAGLALVGLGHVGTVDGLFADAQRAFLDGPGAPLRNVHKFDVVLRLPLILGLTHLLGVALRAAAGRRLPARIWAGAVTGTALVAIAGVATPALAGGLAPPGSFAAVPGYWKDAAGWLNRTLGDEQLLVVPGARFPQYQWGRPSDEITQALLTRKWGVRNSIPLTPPATIRLLDSIEESLATGAGSPGLADLLARSGVRYLLLRSDLDYGRAGATQPIVVRQALSRSPGLRPVTAFGPTVGGGLPGIVVDDGLDVPVRALEVWQVERTVRPVTAYDAAGLTTVVGGPESLLAAAAAGRLPAGPTVLAGDRPADLTAGPVVLTDGMRRREIAFGLAADRASATLAAGDEGRLGAPARDYLPDWGDAAETVVQYSGIRAVTASSSYADADQLHGSRPAHQPFAALDGDLGSSWRSAPGAPSVGQWLQVELPGQRSVPQIELTLDDGADSLPTRITVQSGHNEPITREVFGTSVSLPLPADFSTDSIRITVDEVRDVRLGSGGVGIAELSIPGVTAHRTLMVPSSPVAGRPAAMVFSAAASAPACYFDAGRPYCSAHLSRESEDGGFLDRTVVAPVAARYEVTLSARPRPGPDLNALLDPGGAASVTEGITPSVTASSTGVPDPAARPGVVTDGDIGTTWWAGGEDTNPWLRLGFLRPRQVNGIRIRLAAGTAASRPWQVTVLADDGIRTGSLTDDGSLRFNRPLQTGSITVLFAEPLAVRSLDPYRDTVRELPIGVSELSVLDDPPIVRADPDRVRQLRCGSGPTMAVDGVRRTSALVASRRQLLQMQEVPARLCGPAAATPVPVAAGMTRVVAIASPAADPIRLSLAPLAAGQGAAAPASVTTQETPVRVDEWGPTARRLHLDAYPNPRVLALRENTNAGWQATLAGATLRRLVVDGWQQGWIVPAGAAGEVVLRFTPDRGYAAAISVGAVLLTGVAVAALVPSRKAGWFTAPAAVAAGRRRRWVLPLLIGTPALLLVGGVAAAGLAAVGLAAVVAAWALRPYVDNRDRRRLRQAVGRTGALLPVVLFALAGWFTVTGADPHTAALPQLAAVGAGVTLWLSVLLAGGLRRR